MENNIYEVLSHLEKRKGLYLGNDYTFDTLQAFIFGYSVAGNRKQLESKLYPNFSFFGWWLLGHIEKHYGQAGGWHWQIRQRNPKNDEKAFKEFFVFLDKFKKAKVKRKEMFLDKDAMEFYAKNVKTSIMRNGKLIPYKSRPIRIVWNSFSNSKTIWIEQFDKKNKCKDEMWNLNSKEALKNLKSQFGVLKNKWTKIE